MKNPKRTKTFKKWMAEARSREKCFGVYDHQEARCIVGCLREVEGSNGKGIPCGPIADTINEYDATRVIARTVAESLFWLNDHTEKSLSEMANFLEAAPYSKWQEKIEDMEEER